MMGGRRCVWLWKTPPSLWKTVDNREELRAEAEAREWRGIGRSPLSNIPRWGIGREQWGELCLLHQRRLLGLIRILWVVWVVWAIWMLQAGKPVRRIRPFRLVQTLFLPSPHVVMCRCSTLVIDREPVWLS